MADLLVQFDEPHYAADGRQYVAQVYGGVAVDDSWEGWIEFVPVDGGDALRTGRETEQFTRGDLRYWAALLSRGYLEEAFSRALMRKPVVSYEGATFGETKGWIGAQEMVFETAWRPAPVFDPFVVYRESGRYRLRQRLRTLDAGQLQDMIAAYEIPGLEIHDMHRTFEDALAEQIVAEVQHRVESGRLAERDSGASAR